MTEVFATANTAASLKLHDSANDVDTVLLNPALTPGTDDAPKGALVAIIATTSLTQGRIVVTKPTAADDAVGVLLEATKVGELGRVQWIGHRPVIVDVLFEGSGSGATVYACDTSASDNDYAAHPATPGAGNLQFLVPSTNIANGTTALTRCVAHRIGAASS